jgi:hypothetical protein
MIDRYDPVDRYDPSQQLVANSGATTGFPESTNGPEGLELLPTPIAGPSVAWFVEGVA